MRITKLGHACVRLEQDGSVLVIDPGSFTEEGAAVGADAVAVTHEHGDHLDLEQLRAAARARPGLDVYAHASVAEGLAELTGLGARVHSVRHGDSPSVGGFSLHVYGETHAVIHDDIPVVANVGFRVQGSSGALFHPGDAFTVPEDPVELLLLPISAPWSKAAEVTDYARAAAPGTVVPIHDALLSAVGAAAYERIVGGLLPGVDYRRLEPGQGAEF